MIVQIGHSREYDFQKELYEPIKHAPFFLDHTFIFPHEREKIDSQNTLPRVDVFFAEVSYASIGLGIEIGMAKMLGKKIICFHKKGVEISSSIKIICDMIFEYTDTASLIEIIGNHLCE